MNDIFNLIVSHVPEIAGALIMAAIGAYLLGLNNRRNRFAAASAKFNSDILTILSGLYPLASSWPEDINALDAVLRSVFPKMQIAVEEFKRCLPWYKKIFFNRAWSRFRNAYGRDQDIQCYHHYMPFEGVSIVDGKEIRHDNTTTYKETFKKNVDRLLKYAKKK